MIQDETLNLLEWPRLCQHLSTFAATKLGAIAARRLVIPASRQESEQLLVQTREAYQLELRLAQGLSFGGLRDIWDALERAERGSILTGQDLLDVATTLAGARQLRRTIDAQENVPVLQALVADMRTYPELEQAIHHAIDDNGRVADRASVRLGNLRDNLRSLRDRIYSTLQRILQRQAGAIQEPVITQRGDRFVIPVKAPQKDAIPGIVHDASTSGATLYIEPQSIINFGNQLRQVTRQEQAEEERICQELTERVAEVLPDLEELLAIATTLDLATARARYSLWLNANPPRLIDRSAQERIVLRQLRHPLLVWQHQHEEGGEVVPIDLIVQPQTRVVAITGPNTGGKTVTLKTLGLACLMAKVGLFIPGREPVEMPWFEHILADIGDEQSLQQSLSTFSGHIRRISRILDAIGAGSGPLERKIPEQSLSGEESDEESSSSEWLEDDALEKHPSEAEPSASQDLSAAKVDPANALILLDEVGAGTDPSEGSALAIALLCYLADQAQFTVATTHFGELKALKYQDERFENASVEFDDVSLSPTYKLLWGIPGRSNALAIAARLGLNTDILEQAQKLVGVGGTDDVNQVIAGLEAQRRSQEAKAKETETLLRQAERLHEEVSQRAAVLKERERELKQQQEQQVQQAIAAAKAEIAGVIRRLQQGPVTAQEAQKATEELGQIAESRLPSQKKPPKPKPGYRPVVGDRVRIPRLGQTAEVLTNPDEDGELTVRFGLMKMTVSLADVESLQGEKAEVPTKPKPEPEPKPAPAPALAPAVRTSRNTLDLRGSRVADAEIEIDRAIARVGSGPLWIIHGHGTGRLKKGVQDFLRQHPQISQFEAAEPEDGGTGVTVAQIQ